MKGERAVGDKEGGGGGNREGEGRDTDKHQSDLSQLQLWCIHNTNKKETTATLDKWS